ncbi:MAG: CHAT domain-containing tetratricopeptide repeat protein [Bacteroidota bacterium]
MKHLIGLLLIVLTNAPLFAQSWQELYQQADDCTGDKVILCCETLERALMAAKEEFGDMDSIYLLTLTSLGDCYVSTEKYETALEMLQLAVVSTKQSAGPSHPDYIDRLNGLALLQTGMGNYEQAQSLLEEALDLSAQHLGKDHAMYGITLNNFGELFQTMGKYEQALPMFEEAIINIEESKGKQHSDYGALLNNLGRLYESMGMYDQALPMLEENVSNALENFGNNHLRYGIALSNLGNLYLNMGQFDLALSTLQQALVVKKQSLGKDHAEVGNTLGTLGSLYQEIGKYQEALQMLEAAVDNAKTSFGETHLNYGIRLNNLGLLHKGMGNYEQALPYYKGALHIIESNLGKDHGYYGTMVSNIGNLYTEMKDYDQALPLLLEAMERDEKALGKEHPKYGIALNNLGTLYKSMGKYEEAYEVLHASLLNAENSLGKQHPEYGIRLNNLGSLYISMEKYDLALPMYQEALQNTKNSLGELHSLYDLRLTNSGTLYERLGEFDKALPLFEELSEVLAAQLASKLTSLNDQLQTTFLHTKKGSFDYIFSFMFAHPEFSRMKEIGFNQQLLLKGFLQNQRIELLQGLRSHPDMLVQQKYVQWEDMHRTLAKEYQKPLSRRQASFDSLKVEAGRLEANLAQLSLDFRKIRKQVSWEEVQASLSPQEAVLEFAHFPIYQHTIPTDSVMYVAFVLTSQDSHPRMVPLFEEKALQQVFAANDQAQALDQLYGTRGIKPRSNPGALATLTTLLGQALDQQLAGIQTVYFSPSGLLQRINLGAIALDKKTLLGDKYRLVQVGNSRSLVFQPAEQTSFSSNKALLYGGIQYDTDEAEESFQEESIAEVQAETELSQIAIHARSGDSQWTHLEGTAQEINKISQLLQAKGYDLDIKQGRDATEQSLKKLTPSPRILHIATHGYFFPDPSTIPSQETSGNSRLLQLSDHPMVRSGLILAGANHAWQGNTVPEGEEDGILTAYEISRMDLSNTELVVLSACETGLGDIQGNEGVYGLQRAFKIAGAKYILMSLWQVPDQATQELVTAFYEYWLGGMEIRAALQEAQKEIRKKYKEPYYWAGFVLVE